MGNVMVQSIPIKNPLMLEVRALNRRFKKARKNSQREFDRIKVEASQLQERILRGDTTGNRFSDYCIGLFGVFGTAKMAWVLQEFDKQIIGKTGQLILFIKRGVFGGTDCLESSPETEYFLGILLGDELMLKGTYCGFPIKEYAYFSVEKWFGKRSGSIMFDIRKSNSLEKAISVFGIVIGTKNVIAYVPSGKPLSASHFSLWQRMLVDAARMLGKHFEETPHFSSVE